MSKLLTHLTNPLRSRKVRVALATVLTSIAAECGLHVSEQVMKAILGVGAALILGIAHEDAATKFQLPPAGRNGSPNH